MESFAKLCKASWDLFPEREECTGVKKKAKSKKQKHHPGLHCHNAPAGF